MVGQEAHGLTSLPDGCYPNRMATVHVKGGKVYVIIHDDFDLKPGTALPLLRQEHNLEVEGAVTKAGLFNGHSII